MPLTKRYMKDGRCRVTFKVPAAAGRSATEACVVGESNGWDGAASPMKKLKDGPSA